MATKMSALVFQKHYFRKCFSFYTRRWSSNNPVPPKPTWEVVDDAKLPQAPVIDRTLIQHLERLALVDFGNQEGIDRLTKAIRFADQMMLVDTENIRPMTSVLEDHALYLRKDEVTEGQCRDQLMKLPQKTVEEYYVSPPGNIPLEAGTKQFDNDTVISAKKRS